MTFNPIVRLRFGAVVCCVILAGCATHTWAPGPDARGTFDEAKARCSLMARHSGGGFYASGTPSFVAGAAVGAAIGEAVRANADFNDCMQASGWVIADGQPPTASSRPQTQSNFAPAPSEDDSTSGAVDSGSVDQRQGSLATASYSPSASAPASRATGRSLYPLGIRSAQNVTDASLSAV